MKLYALLIAVVIAGIGFHFLNQPEPPSSGPKRDAGMVQNRREMIRYYERLIMSIERQLGFRVVLRMGDTNAVAKFSHVARLTSGEKAHIDQILEYNRRIATMKGEIGE